MSAGSITSTTSDRHSNTSLPDPVRGGPLPPLQHPFWLLSHPEAHIPILPAPGPISDILSKFSQCIIPGRDPTQIALSITGPLGRTVRGHHTFMVGFDTDTRAHHTPVTPITAIPTGTKTMNRLAPIRSGRSHSTTTQSLDLNIHSSCSRHLILIPLVYPLPIPLSDRSTASPRSNPVCAGRSPRTIIPLQSNSLMPSPSIQSP